ncbi:MAG: thermonuclease family protein, partial [Desulfobacterales bacterium]|nr:thermonuclease family protein [Desulfobacterales bacterium]
MPGEKGTLWNKGQAIHVGDDIWQRSHGPVKDTDRYGRIVGEVILPDGLNLNKELVYVGLAWWY